MQQSANYKQGDPGPMPEKTVQEHGIPNLPALFQDDEVMKEARACLVSLFSRFEGVEKHKTDVIAAGQTISDATMKKATNKVRREIGPAAFLVVFYLINKVYPYNVANPNDTTTTVYLNFFNKLGTELIANQSLADFVKVYSIEQESGLPILQKNLPQLRAAIHESAVAPDLSELEMLCYSKDRQHELELGKLQWTAIKIFINHKVEKGQNEYLIIEQGKAAEQIEKINRVLTTSEKID